MKSILVIGMGRFGLQFAQRMQELGNDVMVVDKDADLIDELAPTRLPASKWQRRPKQ